MEATNAPGLSAYNKAERRRYHLRKAMMDVVLPYDIYGSHFANGKTVDQELEKRNFKAAGDNLFFPHRRLPTLIPIAKNLMGMAPLTLEGEVYKSHIQFPTLATRIIIEDTISQQELSIKYGKTVPYDAFLSSCQDKVESRTSMVCYKYHAI